MDQPPFRLGPTHRKIVLDALLDRRQWQASNLVAAHVRTNHVHLVVETEVRPERIMNDLKSYASRCLNQQGTGEPGRKRWARNGSTRWLWKPEHVSAAIGYVLRSRANRWLFSGLTNIEADRSLWSRLR
jgi:REP element-mobilizing transposase RayT